MAIPKQVKIGGSYYKGHTLTVTAAPGDYATYMSISAGGCAVNGITIVPSKAGSGDTYKLEHMDATTGGSQVALIAESIPNLGANVAMNLDLFSMEKMGSGHALKITYSNVASTSMEVFVIIERGR